MRKLNVALVVPPLREKVSFYPPFGALSMVAVAKERGHNARLLDLDADRCSHEEAIKRILGCSPDVIGISAVVSTSYKYVKEISARIKKKLSTAVIIIGGGLSAASSPVLNNTKVDVVVHGEGELTFRELLGKIEKGENWEGVAGISFKKDNKIIKNPPRELIKNLDILPFPDYDLLRLDKYILNIHEFTKEMNKREFDKLDKRVRDKNRSPNILRINISRGCVNRCSFCYRNTLGIRIHSFEYIGDLIEYVTKKYNIGHISFGDESFGPYKKWLRDFIKTIKERRFDLTYHITGMRVHAVDEDIMAALKEIGVWHIQFGFESGSQKILNMMEKNTTVEQNIKAALLAKKIGINTVPFIIIGYPGETRETLHETIDFLKKIDLMSGISRPTLPMAMPGTPLYEYAQLKGHITDEDKYLEAISNVDTTILSYNNYFINYTDESDHLVFTWRELITNEINKFYGIQPAFNNKSRLLTFLNGFLLKIEVIGVIGTLKLGFNKLLKTIVAMKRRIFHFNRSKNDYLASNIPSEGISLRKINEKLKEKIKANG